MLLIAACPLPWSHPPLRGLFLLVKEKVKAERQKIVPEFKQLRQYLEEQECLLLARLGELEKQIKSRLKENADKFSKKIIYLDGLIKEKERRLSGHESLQVRSAETPALSWQTACEAPANQKHVMG
ncbi:PREDICTED: tripartite motif-containing protein 15-like [Pygoscelis adeliae]|uniref:tripartite motif-containing protein 15-like n=1 Tax=Pygoscelis adeliae TaxID=9238 RepID=UPI0004F5027A|nr:PREDICTED: tripartite motif-containing protein 15-like [Pygoscelis adeliae]